MADRPKTTYKELTLHQLRSFCETARLGSFASAAASLGLSHPTVLEQVHALERDFGAKLVEPHGRGCDLTAAGRLLVELAGPAVESIETLRMRFLERSQQAHWSLTVATTPRILVEDLSGCVADFQGQSPNTSFTFLETDDDEVLSSVERRHADLGFTPTRTVPDQSSLTFEHVYSLEIRLIAPVNHPLAKRRTIRPKDLSPYPLVNAPEAFSCPSVRTTLDRTAGYTDRPFQVRAQFAGSIRQFVTLGAGVALLLTHPSAQPKPGFFEFPMSKYFGVVPVYLVRRPGGYLPQVAETFLRHVRHTLGTD